MRVACVAGARKWWAKERTGAREGDTRAHYFKAPAMQATMRGSEELKDNGKSHTVKPRHTRYLIITSLLCPW